MLVNRLSALKRLIRHRGGAAAVVVALTMPAAIVAVGAALETSYYEVRLSQLQAVADAAATASRKTYDSSMPGFQQAAVTEAQRIASMNDLPRSVADADVVQGWWDITVTDPTADKFGPPIAGQTGQPFSNAIRVTAREDHKFAMGSLLGLSHLPISKHGTGYKCSNLDYPYTLVPDDVPSPSLPAIYMSWATTGHDAKTSYYYQQANGDRNPIFKFYSPTDGDDVSFVLYMSSGETLQVDTYCRGTYLVSPASFDARRYVDKNGQPATITATVKRGSSNNSFDVYSDQTKYPFAFTPTPFYAANMIPTPQYNLSKIKTTPYPSSNGIQYWASEGNPTPDRRVLLIN